VKGLTGAGSVNMPARATATLTLDGPGDAVFSGAVNGTGTIVHSGIGHQTFSGTNTCNCALEVEHGIVSIVGGNGRWVGPISVHDDGAISLYGGGHAQGIAVNNGHLQVSESAGAIGFSSTIDLTSATFDVSGNSALHSLGELHVTGNVTLTNSTLALHLPADFDADVNTAFTVIDNDAADLVSGTFAGLPEGAPLTIGRFTFQISYVGGSGNDVVLTLENKTPIARRRRAHRGRGQQLLHDGHTARQSQQSARADPHHVPERRRHDGDEGRHAGGDVAQVPACEHRHRHGVDGVLDHRQLDLRPAAGRRADDVVGSDWVRRAYRARDGRHRDDVVLR
jgi:hypothetical protein